MRPSRTNAPTHRPPASTTLLPRTRPTSPAQALQFPATSSNSPTSCASSLLLLLRRLEFLAIRQRSPLPQAGQSSPRSAAPHAQRRLSRPDPPISLRV